MKANQKFRNITGNQNAMWALLIEGVFAIIIAYAALSIGGFINGTIGNSLYGTLPSAATSRNTFQNQTYWGLLNASKGYTTNVGMINIAAQIAIITIPLMMVMFIRKMAQ